MGRNTVSSCYVGIYIDTLCSCHWRSYSME